MQPRQPTNFNGEYMHPKMTFFWMMGVLCSSYFQCSHNLTDEELRQKAMEIHQKILTIDSHVDTPLQLLYENFDLAARHDTQNGGGRLDLPRMKEGGLDAAFFAVFVGQGERTPAGNLQAKERALMIFDRIYDVISRNNELAEIALTPADAYRLQDLGKRAIYIGIENGYTVGQDLNLLEHYFKLGARYVTLCHTKNNDICDSSNDEKGPEHGGLSEFGKQVVAEMNRLGMMVDVSHVSDAAFYDVLELTQAPVIASHSCARALCDNPRNLDDAMLKKLAENDGVIQMCIFSDYVKTVPLNPEREAAIGAHKEKYKNWDSLSVAEQKHGHAEWIELDQKFPRETATVADVVNHIDHMIKVAGINHVGIGTDFDGGGGLNDCNDVSELKNITLELVRRGYSEEEIEKIWSGNFIRVFRKVERIAEVIQAQATR
jgi:membrane dipeptidase